MQHTRGHIYLKHPTKHLLFIHRTRAERDAVLHISVIPRWRAAPVGIGAMAATASADTMAFAGIR
jgi:hypothetical protein